ncbi:hypothetical protein [Thioclava sp. GXIMD4216]|uniref:hypothetical protein n=1 Tax=unclassified Thioclava TaxID=2621713 RepID=UPI0030CE5A99
MTARSTMPSCKNSDQTTSVLQKLRLFRKSENGAVSTEWIVLTAVVAALALAVTKVIGAGALSASTKIADYLESVEIQDDF